MKSWKRIAGFLFLFGFIVVIFNFSNKPNVQTSEVQSSLELNKPTKKVIPNSSNQTNPKSTPPSIADLSISELSELSKQYIVQCKDPYAFFDSYSEESFEKMQDKVFEAWSISSEFEQQLAITLINTNLKAITLNGQIDERKYAHTSLSKLVEDFPNSELAHYFLVSNCSIEKNCEQSIFDNALAQDPYNGALWRLIAIREAASGDIESTLAAIENSIAAANYESYWGETTHLFEQALATTVEMDERTRQVAAIGYSAALVLPNFKTLLDFCRQHSTQRADIANACLRMGARQFLSGDNLLEQSIGLAIQKLVYEQQNSSLEAEKIASQIQEFRSTTAKFAIGPNLALHDKNLNKYWWENILLYGETKALQLTYAEAVRLSSDPSYDPCPSGKIEPETISNQ